MAIVTLTTDLGQRDYYAGAIKGALLRHVNPLVLVDITHQIEPFNVLQGAFVLRGAFTHFPEGSVHLALVNGYAGSETVTLITRYRNHWFVAPDNGLLPLLWEGDEAGETYRAQPERAGLELTVPLAQAVTAAALLASGRPVTEFGQPYSSYQRLNFGQPAAMRDTLRGEVIHIDHFGNCIVNIHKKDFERFGNGRAFTIQFKRYDELQQLSRHYGSVDQGQLLCFFNAAGYLEIALRYAQAAKLLNLRVRDIIMVTFRAS